MDTLTKNLPQFSVNGISVPIVQELSKKLQQQQQEATNTINIPNRYIRSQNERSGLQTHEQGEEEEDLPIIDMSLLYDSPHHMQHFLQACQQHHGFFQVVNHGIPPSLLQRMKDVSKEFFGLPLNEKLKYADVGREGYGQTSVFSDQQSLDWSDKLYMLALPRHLRNLDVWPQTPIDFRCTVDQYSTELERLGIGLLKFLGAGLGLKPHTKLVDSFEKLELYMRLNYYPPCPNPELALGISPHTDATLITMLLQNDDIEGLQIFREEKQTWQTVKPIPGAILMNFGDFIEEASFKADPCIYCYENYIANAINIQNLYAILSLWKEQIKWRHFDGYILFFVWTSPPCFYSCYKGTLLYRHNCCKSMLGIPTQRKGGVHPKPQVLSNGMYKSTEHRAVTNAKVPRLSVVGFYCPGETNQIISPIQDLIDEHHPSYYKSFTVSEFYDHFWREPIQGKQRSLDFITIKTAI